MATTFSIVYDTQGRLGDAANFIPDKDKVTGVPQPGLWIEGSNAAGGESAGIFLNGNVMCAWSPGDNDLLRLLDEDGLATNTPVLTITNTGAILHKGAQIHADYVFAPEYQLESVEEHADFMTRAKHLSAVPRPGTDEHGNTIVDYGAFMRGLLEELEKAHVYIAGLSDLVKEQRNTLSTLSMRVDALVAG